MKRFGDKQQADVSGIRFGKTRHITGIAGQLSNEHVVRDSHFALKPFFLKSTYERSRAHRRAEHDVE
jgi:hypothetical protein